MPLISLHCVCRLAIPAAGATHRGSRNESPELLARPRTTSACRSTRASERTKTQIFEADARSRVKSENTEWPLGQEYFDKVNIYFGPFEIDLFATAIIKKCHSFVSWHPDLLAHAVNAFLLNWRFFLLLFLAFPPISL